MACRRFWESAGGRLREAIATAGKKENIGSFVMRFGVGEDPDLSGKRLLLTVWPVVNVGVIRNVIRLQFWLHFPAFPSHVRVPCCGAV